ncbi:MAG: cytochrome P450 [Phototrophicaceae bacterium]
MTTDINMYPIFHRKTRANPQALYEQMRQETPIWKAIGPQTGNSIWFFTQYEDVSNVLKDQRFVKNARKNLPPEIVERYMPLEIDPTWEAINRHMLNLDAPDHTRLRSLVHKAFTPKRVRDLEPRIEAIAQELLEDMKAKSEGDLIDDFAFPLPITVIAEMLGVEKEARDDFRRWTRALLFGMSEAESRIAVMEFAQYMNERIAERRNNDKGDILSALVQVEEDGDKLDHMELLSMIFLLLVAGHETTVNLIGNGTLLLLQHPEQKQQLIENRSLLKTAVEEMLRYNGPVETPTIRYASEDIEVSGVTIPMGDMVLPSLLAANRDATVFDKPNEFDITRDPNPHIAFGQGIHYCLGAPLARMEGTIAINALLDHLPNIDLNTDVESLRWTENILIHGLQALPVKW